MNLNEPIDLGNLRTKSIQRTLAPFVDWITVLKNEYQPEINGRVTADEAFDRVQSALAALLHKTQTLIEAATAKSSLSNASIEDLNRAHDDLLAAGNIMLTQSDQFVRNTSDYGLRQETAAVARETLLAVVALLIVADTVDGRKITERADYIRKCVEGVCDEENTRHQLLNITTHVDEQIEELTKLTRRRFPDLAMREDQDNLQSSMALLKITLPLMEKSSLLAVTVRSVNDSQLVRHVERLQKFAVDDISDALMGVSSVISGKLPSKNAGLSHYAVMDPLSAFFEEFKRSVYMEPHAYQDIHRGKLEELLEKIGGLSAVIADDPGTNPIRRANIVDGVNDVRAALQDLLTEYEKNKGRSEASENLDMATVHLEHKLVDLRRHLRRAITDKVSDAFSSVYTPLQMLLLCAREGDQDQVRDAVAEFRSHSENLCRVANLVCKMVPEWNRDGVAMLRYSAHLLESLSPQVVDAALVRFLMGENAEADQNLTAFANLWEDRAKAMTAAVDALISVDDFVAVGINKISDDAQNGLRAIYAADHQLFDEAAGKIRGRCHRICDVTEDAMKLLPASGYTEVVRNASLQLRHRMPQFEKNAERLINELQTMSTEEDVDKDLTQRLVDEMIDECALIDGAVKDIRRALLTNRNIEDVDSDIDYEEDDGTATALADQRSQISDSDADNQQRVMRHLPEESKREIQKQIDVFRIVQRKFEYEVGRWDEEGNDLIALAKQMCQIMMNMTDFTKGRGPFRTTMDIIKAAQGISEKGAQLKVIADGIGKDAVESQTKKDLFIYIERIILFCHQLNVTSKVKADVQVVDDELRVSGLEAVTSLIQNAKNLLNAVIQAVKLAYIASTKYRKGTGGNVVEWRMVTPHQQPMGRPTAESTPIRNGNGIVRRFSEKRAAPPMRDVANMNIRGY